ncbi:MAG: hypothetical protein JRJ85_15575 [Deltaproteobacteria bacterium]|nr:hypothetical protein [Deltaproteobacteria bacterium]
MTGTENFIVTGGKRKDKSFSMNNLADSFEAGIYEIDFGEKRITRQHVESTPDDRIYTKSYSLSFRGGVIFNETLFTCTHSEIIEFDTGNFSVKKRISNRLFNDLHHVNIINDRMMFASTGIDRVGEFVSSDEIKLYPVLNDLDPISDEEDYRVISTKPHVSHPNYVFKVGQELWATRFNQKDAVSLNNFGKKIDISAGKPHDGLIRDGRLYFTTVNGMIVVFDLLNLNKIATLNLSSLFPDYSPGWCRGLEIIGEFAYVGFSALRWTLSLENIGFLAKNFISLGKKLRKNLPARIVKYNMMTQRIVDEYCFDQNEIGLIFSIIRL